MRKNVIRVFSVIAIIQAAYLVLANLALNLPLTQTLVNDHKPDKYAVYWERAWTWYPLRFHARGISVNGQTSSQQWQAEVPSVSASLSVFPLLQRTFRISRVDAEDVEFRIRPRSRPDKDYAAIRKFFPLIQNRDPDLPAAPKVRKAGDGWTIVVDDIRAYGTHKIWVYQVRGALNGGLAASLSYTTRGGPFALSDGEADVEVTSLVINDESAISRGGTVVGRFETAPFVPSKHRGSKALGFVTADVRVHMLVDSLDFLDIYLRRFNGMEVDGKGVWTGRLNYTQGDLVSGTDMAVSASELVLNAAPYKVQGTGDISIEAGTEDPETMSIGMVFGTVNAFHGSDQTALFSGEKLEIEAQGDNRILLDEERVTGHGRVVVRIPKVAVPDLQAYQYLLPDQWRIQLNGGTGELAGQAELSSSLLNANLRIQSDDADIAFQDYRFVTSLDLSVVARGGASDTASIDLGGTYLKLDDARLASEENGASKRWQASLSISEGTLKFPVAEGATEETGFRHVIRTMKEQELREVLAKTDAELDAHLSISDLGWLNVLFRNPFDLEISGSGEAEAAVDIRSGWLAEGTALRVLPQDLQVHVLDYVAQGDGLLALAVERGGETPDMILDATLSDGSFKRRGEEKSVVEGVSLEVTAKAQGVTFGEGSTVAAIDLRIPSARVRDMSVYNQYFPDKLPLRLTGGEAELTADIHLEPESTGGYVKLQTNGLQSELDEQQMSGELTLDINLEGGVPSNMDFDISGSSLRLKDFKVVGDQKSYDRPGWAARFDLDKARAIWKKPVLLNAEGAIAMNDSRPIVALLANQRGKHGWIEKLLTVEDIQGNAKLTTGSGEVLIPYAFAGSDKIDVGAKGVINEETREGVFFARFRKLNGILKVKDGKRNFDIIGAKKTFDTYSPGETNIFMEKRE